MPRTKRGKTERFILNEKFIFGNPRCMQCGKVVTKGEGTICNECRRKMRKLFI